ncbi:hypothetical protein CDAR_217421 [Caerostris darwini]|uniref:Uncharacterized protein n=1 Tax=Caerostris darwini TaxID=1538125 RepID=A0AAV4VDU1_9ARAC|nr:hypothetical protein CDAR_217421 [Caerostris darwini]
MFPLLTTYREEESAILERSSSDFWQMEKGFIGEKRERKEVKEKTLRGLETSTVTFSNFSFCSVDIIFLRSKAFLFETQMPIMQRLKNKVKEEKIENRQVLNKFEDCFRKVQFEMIKIF